MGLDRTAGALLVAQSDAPGAARVEEVAVIRTAFEAAGASEVFATDDPEEGEMFVEARRAAFPAIEAQGSLLLEDVGAPIPQLPQLLADIAAIAEAHDIAIPVVAHAGDGNTHPIIVFDPNDPAAEQRAQAGVRRGDAGGDPSRRHDQRRARRRTHQEVRASRPARARRDGADPTGQGRA